MTVVTVPTPPSVAEILRGDPRRRPATDRDVAAGLRADLEDRLFDLGVSRSSDVRSISGRDFRSGPVATDVAAAPSARLRGALVDELIRLWSVNAVITAPFTDALAAWIASGRDDFLSDFVAHVSADERARIETDVTAHAVTLLPRLGSLPAGWRSRTKVSCVARLAGGSVVLRDVVDLVVGSIASDVATLALCDVTTSPLDADVERLLRFHALSYTLRSHVAPLRVVSFSSATGDVVTLEVDGTALRRSLDDVVELVAAKEKSA